MDKRQQFLVVFETAREPLGSTHEEAATGYAGLCIEVFWLAYNLSRLTSKLSDSAFDIMLRHP